MKAPTLHGVGSYWSSCDNSTMRITGKENQDLAASNTSFVNCSSKPAMHRTCLCWTLSYKDVEMRKRMMKHCFLLWFGLSSGKAEVRAYHDWRHKRSRHLCKLHEVASQPRLWASRPACQHIIDLALLAESLLTFNQSEHSLQADLKEV